MITHVAAASAGGFQTSVTVDVPSGTADGDLVLAWLSANDADTLTPPSGWAQSFRHQIGTGTAVWLYTRTAASEPASYTWEWNASHQHHVILSTWRGAAAVRDHGVASAEGVTSIDMPSLTAVADDMLVGLGFHWSGTAGTEPTFPATMDTLITQATISAAAQEPITADGPTTTHTVSSSGSGRMAAAAVLLEPEGEDPGPGPEPNGAARRASYEFFVDWDTDGGLALGDFEAGLDGWGRFPEPPAPPEPTPAGIRSVSSVESAAAGSFTCPAPAGAADGDVLVAVQSTDLGDDTDLTTPSGWSLLETVTGGTDSLHTKAWWKVAASEPADYTFTHGTGANSVVSIAAVQGADGSVTPVVASFAPFTDDTLIPTPGITPTHADDVELRWAGAQYEDPPPEQFTKTYDAVWSASWYGFGKRSGTRLYQGDTLLGDGTGKQYGKAGFDHATIQSDLAGSTIDRVELRLSNEHSWFSSGLTARIGTHNNAAEPGGSTSTDGAFNRSSYAWNKGETKYVDLPVAVGEDLRDDTAKGITTGRPTAGDRNDYGYFRGYNASSSQRPRLRITYTTAGSQPITITAPTGFTQRSEQSSNDFTGASLATRQLTTSDTTATHTFTAAHTYARAHGVTVAVASLQPTPEPDESPTLQRSTGQAYSGDASMLITWSDGATQYAFQELPGLIEGRTYTASAWVWVPSGGTAVRLAAGGEAGAPSTGSGQWEQIEVVFTASASTGELHIEPAAATAGGEQVYVDVVQVLGEGEDITHRVLGLRTTVDISYGRDQARNLSAIAPGQTGFEVDNRSGDYSPDNPASPLAGQVGPGRPVLIRATWQGKLYSLFRGFLDDYELDPARESRSVQFTALDTLARLRNAKVSTGLYPSLRTGEAIGVLLDAIGWPADRRDLDAGATTLRWWWGESGDAFDVLSKVVEAEGPAAFAFVSSSGDFVFRDRHHRLQREASLNVQATFRDTGTEPVFSRPVEYDIGWKDIVNSIEVDVAERAPVYQEVVWEDEGVLTLAASERRTIRVQADDPFLYAVPPVAGHRITSADQELIVPADYDYVVLAGEVSVSLSRTSGQSTEIRMEAGPAGATIRGLRLRATPVPVVRTVQVRAEDEQSIAVHGRRSYEGDLDLAGVHDVADIAQIILGQRADRLPIMTITVVGRGHTQRMDQILRRDLSDRIHIVEPQTFTDHDFYIERIEHSIADVGYDHQAAFGCERVREQHEDALLFDDETKGFGEGVFALSGIDDPDRLFVLDQSTLDEGLMGH
ncbi:MAG TPA: hypothetical protein VKZ89_16895 [Thermobifida alba]|nr:hypothetical protein [Thermobifida alba]